MFARELRLSTGNKFAAIIVGSLLLVVVGVFLAFGFLLILGLMVIGLLLGIGAALYRRLAGRPSTDSGHVQAQHGLDPALEIAPPPLPLEKHGRPERDIMRSEPGE